MYGAKRRCDTPLLSGPPIGCLPYFEFLSDSYPPAPLRHFVALFAPLGSVSLDSQVALLPYSTAITDSLDSQVATAPLRIQFGGVTPVPLPPQLRWWDYGCSALCHMIPRVSVERFILPPE